MHPRALANEAANYASALQQVSRDIHSLADARGRLERALASVSELGLEVVTAESGAAARVTVPGGRSGSTVELVVDVLSAAIGVGAIHLLRTHHNELAGQVVVVFGHDGLLEGKKSTGGYNVRLTPELDLGTAAVIGVHSPLAESVATELFTLVGDTKLRSLHEAGGNADAVVAVGTGPDDEPDALLADAAACLAALAFARLDELTLSA